MSLIFKFLVISRHIPRLTTSQVEEDARPSKIRVTNHGSDLQFVLANTYCSSWRSYVYNLTSTWTACEYLGRQRLSPSHPFPSPPPETIPSGIILYDLILCMKRRAPITSKSSAVILGGSTFSKKPKQVSV